MPLPPVLRPLLVLLILAGVLGAQVPNSLSIAAQAPPSPAAVGATWNGPPQANGGVPVYYWVTAAFPFLGGNFEFAIPTGPATAQGTLGVPNLSATNSVTVSWTAVPGALGYHVLRSDSPSLPANCTSCRVSSVLQTGTTFTDQGAFTGVFPPTGSTGTSNAQVDFTLDNISEARPFINLRFSASAYGRTVRLMPFFGSFTSNNCVAIFTDSDGTSYLRDAGSGACNTGGVASVRGTFSAVSALACNANTLGQTRYVTDGNNKWGQCDGTTVQWFRSGRAIRLPGAAANWTVITGGAATTTADFAGSVRVSSASGDQSVQGAVIPVPATPYIITIGFQVRNVYGAAQGRCGLTFTSGTAAGSQAHQILRNFSNLTEQVQRWTNLTTLGTQDFSQGASYLQPDQFYRVTNDGTNKTFEASGDGGFTWRVVFTTTSNNPFTPTHVGPFCTIGTTLPMDIELFHCEAVVSGTPQACAN